MKKIFSLIYVLIFVSSFYMTCFAEDTTENWIDCADTSWYNATDKEFTINSAEQLAGLSAIVNSQTDDFSRKNNNT